MKVIKSSLLMLMIVQASFLIAQNQKYVLDTTRSGAPMLFGEVMSEAFMQEPFSKWFVKNTEEYEVGEQALSPKMKKSLSKYDITIYMGTWCGDSRKEVPRLIKFLEVAEFDMSHLKILTLNQSKKASNREELGQNIHRVPTIIFSKNGKEKNRIVEHPINTIEQDIHQILNGNKYQPNYYGLEVIHQAISKKGFDVLRDEKFISSVKPFVKQDYELSKYGLIYFRNKEFDKAIAIYDFNAKLFPESDRPYQSKGINYYVMGDMEKAKTNLEKALKINPENKYAKKYLGLIAGDNLLGCWDKQVKPLQKMHLTFSYEGSFNELGHNFEPWQQTNYAGSGTIWSNADNFSKKSTLSRGRRIYNSSIVFNNDKLLFLDYGDKGLFPVTKKMFLDQTHKTARYTPINIINYFVQHEIPASEEKDDEFIIYKTIISETVVKLYVSKKSSLLEKVTTLNDDDLFGDVLTTIQYSDFSQVEGLYYPKNIEVDKINGKVTDKILITKASFVATKPTLLESPSNYQVAKEEITKPSISVEKFNSNIYFINLSHTDDRVMIVEFLDFLLVAEAPINSENGKLIIAEAKKIAPNKPIKYFVFGHHHPHYLGGIRSFIHEEANIICSEFNEEYVKYIANASHTLSPDNLQKEPRLLKTTQVNDSLTISDGDYRMKIYFIGEKSEHTKDYLVYYFPAEKLLFQDDLVWIKKAGEIKKAGKRQAGLYHAILELGLDVDTIIQSWPVADRGVKTIIPFKDLKASVEKI